MKTTKDIFQMNGVDCREVNNSKFTNALFAPLSVWHNHPELDYMFYGYVEDEDFYSLDDIMFEDMVNKDFD